MGSVRINNPLQKYADFQARKTLLKTAQEQHSLSVSFASSLDASSRLENSRATAFPNLQFGLIWEYDRKKIKKENFFYVHRLDLSGGYASRWGSSRNSGNIDFGWLASAEWLHRANPMTKNRLGLSLRLFHFDEEGTNSWMANALYKF